MNDGYKLYEQFLADAGQEWYHSCSRRGSMSKHYWRGVAVYWTWFHPTDKTLKHKRFERLKFCWDERRIMLLIDTLSNEYRLMGTNTALVEARLKEII